MKHKLGASTLVHEHHFSCFHKENLACKFDVIILFYFPHFSHPSSLLLNTTFFIFIFSLELLFSCSIRSPVTATPASHFQMLFLTEIILSFQMCPYISSFINWDDLELHQRMKIPASNFFFFFLLFFWGE